MLDEDEEAVVPGQEQELAEDEEAVVPGQELDEDEEVVVQEQELDEDEEAVALERNEVGDHGQGVDADSDVTQGLLAGRAAPV